MVPKLFQFTEHTPGHHTAISGTLQKYFFMQPFKQGTTKLWGRISSETWNWYSQNQVLQMEPKHSTCSSSLPSRFMARVLILRPSFSLFSWSFESRFPASWGSFSLKSYAPPGVPKYFFSSLIQECLCSRAETWNVIIHKRKIQYIICVYYRLWILILHFCVLLLHF